MELLKQLLRFHKQWIGLSLLILAVVASMLVSPHIASGLKQAPPQITHKKKEQVKSALRKSVTCRADYNQDMSRCLERAQGLGVDAVVLAIMTFQKTSDASEVYIDRQKTIDEAHIRQFIKKAKQNNIVVIIKPILLIEQNVNTIQRDTIKPRNREKWFRSYKSVLDTLMRWGKDSDGIVVGTELTSMQGDTAKWQDIVSSLRKLYPDMLFSYDVNWNALDKPMMWWKNVDLIGFSAYFPLCTFTKKPTVSELITCWNGGTKKSILKYVRQHGSLPFWFTEIGLTAREGSNSMPWGTPNEAYCPECQANWFKAAFEVWDKSPGFVGLTWWSLIGHDCIEKVPNNEFSYFEESTQLVLLEFYTGKTHVIHKQDSC